MPNYDDDAILCGWEKTGAKWTHPAHPGKVFYNARQIYELLPEKIRRPCTATPREVPKPPEPTPPAVEPRPEAQIVMMPRRGRPPKADA